MALKEKSNHRKSQNSIITIVIISTVVIISVFLFCLYRKNTASDNSLYTVLPELLQYKNMTYAVYQELTGGEMEFEHGGLFSGEVPGKDVQIIMAGRYDEELAGYELEEDSTVLRLQGRLADLISMEKDDGENQAEMAVEDFIDKMAGQSCGSLSYEFFEGAGTAYYVDNYYISIWFDSDGDGSSDMLLEISLGNETDSERIGPDSYAWLYLSLPEQE